MVHLKNGKVSRKEVSEKANVSPSTVSRALSDHPAIPQSTKNRIKKIARELGYIPSQIGKSFNQKKSFRLGLVVPFKYEGILETISPNYMSNIIYGILVSASKKNYSLNIVADLNLDAKGLEALVLSHQVDGLIFPRPKISDRRFAYLYKNKVPFIFIHHYVKNRPYLYVDCDPKPGMQAAFRYLAGLNVSKVSFLSGGDQYINSIDRKKIFQELSALHKMKICQIIDGNFSKASGIEAASGFIAEGKPDAILCTNDRMAFGLVQELKERNIRIPEDIRVLGFDNEYISTLAAPHLTTIDNSFSQLGQLAGEKLIASINGKKVESEQIRTKLIIRASA
ncbi:MAG: LacI family DNA-binding transcriptional regulator [SAR324 cluster bacterium]|nr:LacI family DNA-binding transcriptional regulator [SAR324 cluster bacterium]